MLLFAYMQIIAQGSEGRLLKMKPSLSGSLATVYTIDCLSAAW